jgi:hypothetical protein
MLAATNRQRRVGQVSNPRGDGVTGAAITTESQVVQHAGALAIGERTLGEGGEHVRVGMIGEWCGLQALTDDIGDVLHCS